MSTTNCILRAHQSWLTYSWNKWLSLGHHHFRKMLKEKRDKWCPCDTRVLSGSLRHVSELLEDSSLISAEHDLVLILADARGLEITLSSQPHNPLQKDCKADFTIDYSGVAWPVCGLPIHQRGKVAGQGPSWWLCHWGSKKELQHNCMMPM